MKRSMYLFALAIVVLAIPAWASVPQQINYQGYLTDTGGNALDTTVAMTFKLYTDSLAGSLLWTETRPSVSVTDGLFNVRLGQGTSLEDNVFNNAQVWLGITVGNNSEMSPRSRIVSVGYSYRVGTVDGASGGTISGDVNIVGKANIGSGNTNTGTYSFVVGQDGIASGTNATVGGGGYNRARGEYSVVAGGGGASSTDSNSASGSCSAIGGGHKNTASNINATVGGGCLNTASGYAATVGGGFINAASDSAAAVGGGRYNYARGRYSVVAGGGGTSSADSNSARGLYSAIGGGHRNTASNTNATVGGGNTNAASGYSATVGGGNGNRAIGDNSTVGGGRYNYAQGDYSVVAGGGGSAASDGNSASGSNSAIGGGARNIASYFYATVGGGYDNDASGENATVGGGGSNEATAQFATVGGGCGNYARGNYATVGGGWSNDASGENATVGGGETNTASLPCATVGGGYNNHASGINATVGGGVTNTASGTCATVPGGRYNTALGASSFAAGRGAVASHDGSFVWGDSNDGYIGSYGSNQFRVRASGGTWIFSDAGLTAGVTLASGANAWSAISDSTKKRNIRLVDTKDVLERVSQLPIKQWSYKSQDPSIEHIGPMAQDFYKLFHLGDDSLGISTIDPAGIALAAIQELQKENTELKKELNDLRRVVEQMAAKQQDSNGTKTTSAAFSPKTQEPTLKEIAQ